MSGSGNGFRLPESWGGDEMERWAAGVVSTVLGLYSEDESRRRERLDRLADGVNGRVARRIGDARRTVQSLMGEGFTQADMARTLGVGVATYQRMEQGRKAITVAQAEQVAAILGLPTEAVTSPLEGDDLSMLLELLGIFYGMDTARRRDLLSGMRSLMKATHASDSDSLPPRDPCCGGGNESHSG